jgi:hypothetical protein
MQDARRRQNVNLPEFHGIVMDEQDIVQQPPPVNGNFNEDSMEQVSAFELTKRYIDQIWIESFTFEKHVGEMWRKISYHLPTATATIKVLRILFRMMGEKLLFYMNSQEGSRSYKSKPISDIFITKFNEVLNEFLEQSTRTIQMDNKKIVVVLFTPDDVETGYSWCRWKLDTTAILFSTNHIQQVVSERLNKVPTANKLIKK